MERVLIIGCGGSGKSTLARKLGNQLSLPVYHLDQMLWQAGWKQVDPATFEKRLSSALDQPRWLIDGNYVRTLPRRLARCDTVIYLDFSRWICLSRILWRVLTYHGRSRPDMADGCPERVDRKFIRWVWSYRKTHHHQNMALLETAARNGVTVYHFQSSRECNHWLASLSGYPHKRT